MRWTLYMVIKGLAYLVSHLIWPISFACRGWVRRSNSNLAHFLWLFLNDETDFGEEYWLRSKGLKSSFWSAVRWSLWRNNSFNLNYHYLRVSSTGITLPPEYKFRWEQLWVMHKDEETWMEWKSDWTFNVGDRLDESKSRMGSELYKWENANGESLWRYTYAKIHKPFIITLKCGWNERGEAYLDFKPKWYKKKYSEHWTNPL